MTASFLISTRIRGLLKTLWIQLFSCYISVTCCADLPSSIWSHIICIYQRLIGGVGIAMPCSTVWRRDRITLSIYQNKRLLLQIRILWSHHGSKLHTGCDDESLVKLPFKLGALLIDGGFNELGELGTIKSTLWWCPILFALADLAILASWWSEVLCVLIEWRLDDSTKLPALLKLRWRRPLLCWSERFKFWSMCWWRLASDFGLRLIETSEEKTIWQRVNTMYACSFSEPSLTSLFVLFDRWWSRWRRVVCNGCSIRAFQTHIRNRGFRYNVIRVDQLLLWC